MKKLKIKPQFPFQDHVQKQWLDKSKTEKKIYIINMKEKVEVAFCFQKMGIFYEIQVSEQLTILAISVIIKNLMSFSVTM